MTDSISQADVRLLQQILRARRGQLARQREGPLDGKSGAQHARKVLLQDGDDETQRDVKREVDSARSDQDAVALTMIARALQRLSLGSCGMCIACGEAIAVKRLRLVSVAPSCIACETLLERHLLKPTKH